jgi:8-oxo-dGTP pyrophosphatase MutT (NUDIX family)
MKEDTFHLGIKALIQNKESKILLLKVNPKELKNAKEAYWDIPGGRIQRGASVKATLLRELEEETGISKVQKITPFSMVLSNIRIPLDEDDVGLVLGTYICTVNDAKDIKISKEHTEYSWFAPKKAAELLQVKYPKEFVEKLRDL